MNLPKRLKLEPIVDAIFEIRFTAKTPLASILPGFLYAKLGGDKIEATPLAALPDAMRRSDPNLRGLATQKLHWGKFLVLIGDESLGIGCQLPYPGWVEFLSAIEKVLGAVRDLHLVEMITRYSIKYVDLLPTDVGGGGLNKLKIGLKIGDVEVTNEPFTIRTELTSGDYIHVVQCASPAEAVSIANNERKAGVVLDIDSICTLKKPQPFDDFLSVLHEISDLIHAENKDLFFKCLSGNALHDLGPIYE